MLPRDSQFSTTPFVFPLFALGLSHALSPPFIPFATFRPPSARHSAPGPVPRVCGSSLSTFRFASDASCLCRVRRCIPGGGWDGGGGGGSRAGGVRARVHHLEASPREAIIIVKRADPSAKLTILENSQRIPQRSLCTQTHIHTRLRVFVSVNYSRSRCRTLRFRLSVSEKRLKNRVMNEKVLLNDRGFRSLLKTRITRQGFPSHFAHHVQITCVCATTQLHIPANESLGRRHPSNRSNNSNRVSSIT